MRKVGFVFSGASARIAQEAALTQALVEGLTPSGRKILPDVLAGASAGSLNAVMVNAILDPRKDFDWDFYTQEFLFPLKNRDIYRFNGLSMFTESAIFDTSPLEELLNRFIVDKMGYRTFGDLYLPTFISAIKRSTGKAVRLNSRNPQHAGLSVVEIVMASSAIPASFPPVRIKGLPGLFIDGGTGRDGIPVEAMKSEKCDELYVISKMRNEQLKKRDAGLQAHPHVSKGLIGIAESAILSFDYMQDAVFYCELDRAVDIAVKKKGKAFLYQPVLSKNYPLLNFNTQKEQYAETMAWAREHDPEELTRENIRRWRLGLRKLFGKVRNPYP
jgi:predicted acylesterase/phospholipase RssA